MPAWTGERIDPVAFKSWHLGERTLRDASPLCVWLVAIARANEGEEWGVDYLLDRGGFQGLGKHGSLQPRDFGGDPIETGVEHLGDLIDLDGAVFVVDPPVNGC